MKTNKFASIGVSASFFILAMFFAGSVFAGWTCCTPNADGSASSDCGKVSGSSCVNGCCSVETKSRNECAGGVSSSSCINCGGNLVSNACSGTTDTSNPVCRYPSVTPGGLVLKQGQEYDLKANAYNPGLYTITEVRAVSSAPALVSVAPYIKNVCCGWTSGYSNPAVPFRVAALAQGVSVISAKFIAPGTTISCNASTAVTVKDVATPLACIPGAKCVSNTGTFSAGSIVTCSMPKPTDLSLGTPSYEMTCTPFAGTVAKTKIAKTSTTGTFSTFSIAAGVTQVDCKFRYCQKAASGVITCSNWGV